jgi:uncharacterized FlaG/YvyC family protein
MDIGVSIRPVQPSSTTIVRADSAPQRQAVRTDLPEVATVTAPPSTYSVSADAPKRELRAELNAALNERSRGVVAKEIQQKVTYNDAAREIVFSRVDPDTGSVIAQFPDDALLRQRAYVKSITDNASASCSECDGGAAKVA